MKHDDIVKKIIDDKNNIQNIYQCDKYFVFEYNKVKFKLCLKRVDCFLIETTKYSLLSVMDGSDTLEIKCSFLSLRKLYSTLLSITNDVSEKEENKKIDEIRNKVITLADKRNKKIEETSMKNNDDVILKFIEDKKNLTYISEYPNYYTFDYKGFSFKLEKGNLLFGGYKLYRTGGSGVVIECSNMALHKFSNTLKSINIDKKKSQENEDLNEIRNKIITVSDKRNNKINEIVH